MNIEQIKGNKYIPAGKSPKSKSSSKTNRSGKGSDARKTSNRTGKSATNLSLSESKFKNEVAFTKQVLSNTRQKSLDSLKKIKQKINSGAYNNKKIHQEISSLVKNDLSTLQSIFSHSSVKKSSVTISEKRKKHLLNNPDVTKKISNRVLKDLQNL
ncbi:MAG TPA: hypothetical protein VE868_13035 [Balneolaceae bacterium]|nr:hypothetical protein [Balneolaceae bacterium]